jgi:hypothetical protein
MSLLLQVSHFEFSDSPQPHLCVLLVGGKTDRDGKGFRRYVAANVAAPGHCPVQLTRQYFALLGPDPSGYPVCRTASCAGGGLRLDSRFQLSYGTAVHDLRVLLTRLGYPPDLYAEHSARRGATTESAAAGLSTDSLQKVVGWRNAAMPALYTDWRPEQFLECSSLLQTRLGD